MKDYLRLDLNKKTAIRPITLGVEFVGYKIWATHRKLKQQTARRMIRHVTVMCEMLAAGEMTRTEFDRIVASYKGVLQHCDSYGLRTKLNLIYDGFMHGEDKQREVAAVERQEPVQTAKCDRVCYNCRHYKTSLFCGYISSHCEIYGSLDMDQHERHPDTAAATCDKFNP